MTRRENLDRLVAVMTTRGLSCEAAADIVGRSEATIRMYRAGLRTVPDEVVDTLEAWFRADSDAISAPGGV